MDEVVKNASWIIICRAIQAILSLIISMITVRYLGPSNYGLLNYAISIVGFVIPLMKLGLSSIMVQEIVSDPNYEGEILGTSIGLSLISALICILGANSFVSLVNTGERDTAIVCALYSTVLLFQVFELIIYWFQAKLLAKYSSFVVVVAYAIMSVYKIFLLVSQKNIYWFSVANTLDFLIIAAGLLVLYQKKGTQKLSFSWKRGKRLLSISKYYIISDIMVVVFAQTDRIMLKTMIDNTATGYYSAAVSCAGITQFIFAAIIDSMRPLIFEGKKKSEEAYKNNLSKLFSLVTYLSLLQSALMTFFAPLCIRIICGENYEPSIPALQIVVWYTTFSYLGAVRNIWILAEGKQKYLWRINLVGAFANIIMNALLIPDLGVNGAALASLITQFVTNIVTGFIFKPIKDVNYYLLKGFNPLFFLSNIRAILVQLKNSKS